MGNIVASGISAGHLPAGMPPRGGYRDWKPMLPPQAQQPPREYVFPSVQQQRQHVQ